MPRGWRNAPLSGMFPGEELVELRRVFRSVYGFDTRVRMASCPPPVDPTIWHVAVGVSGCFRNRRWRVQAPRCPFARSGSCRMGGANDYVWERWDEPRHSFRLAVDMEN